MTPEDQLRAALSQRADEITPGPEGIRSIEARLVPAKPTLAPSPVSRWRWFAIGAVSSAAAVVGLLGALGNLDLGTSRGETNTAVSSPAPVDGGASASDSSGGMASQDDDTDAVEGADQDQGDDDDADGTEEADSAVNAAPDDPDVAEDSVENEDDGDVLNGQELPEPPCAGAGATTGTGTPTLAEGLNPVVVFVECDETDDVVRHVRPSSADESLFSVMEALMSPVTDDERARGLTSPFRLEATTYLDGAWVEGGRAVINFNAGAPDTFGDVLNGSLEKQRAHIALRRTVFQLPEVLEVEFRLGGDCDQFANWFELDGCEVLTRSGPLPAEFASPDGTYDPAISGRPAVVARGESLNVRESPGVDSEVVTQIAANEVGIRVLDTEATAAGSPWRRVVAPDGTQGWVNAIFLGVLPSLEPTNAGVGDPVRTAASSLVSFAGDPGQGVGGLPLSRQGLFVMLPGATVRQQPIDLIDPAGWTTGQTWLGPQAGELDGASLIEVLGLDRIDPAAIANAEVVRSDTSTSHRNLPAVELVRSDGATTTLVFDFRNGAPELVAAEVAPA